MPATYRDLFKPEDIAAHLRMVESRGQRSCNVHLFRRLADGTVVLCVVADDVAGLLSDVSAALVARGLAVTGAQIYSRMVAGRGAEAVDFFWVRPIGTDDPLARFGEGLLEDLTSSIERRLQARSAHAPTAEAGTRVRFDEAEVAEGRSVLVVDAPDTPGLLLTITVALVRSHLEIVDSDVRSRGGRAYDRFTVRPEAGRLLDAAARARVVEKVSAAIEKSQVASRRHRVA